MKYYYYYCILSNKRFKNCLIISQMVYWAFKYSADPTYNRSLTKQHSYWSAASNAYFMGALLQFRKYVLDECGLFIYYINCIHNKLYAAAYASILPSWYIYAQIINGSLQRPKQCVFPPIFMLPHGVVAL